MRILIIAPYYKPGYKAGGPIQSIYNLSKLLGSNCEIYVLTRSNDYGEIKKFESISENTWVQFDSHQVKYLDSQIFNQKSILNTLNEIKPDYIYFNSFFSATTYQFVIANFFSKVRTQIIIAPRGEFDQGALKLKSLKKKIFLNLIKLFIQSNVKFHATTELEQANIKNILSINSIVAPNVPNIIQTKPRKVIKEKNKTKIAFISRISPKKNLLYAIEILSKINIIGELEFDIIGPKEDENYWEKVSDYIKTHFENQQQIKIDYIGEIPNSELPHKTLKYNYLFFPTLGENYGHIIFECLSYGIPVILSERTPWVENENGVFVRNLNDKMSFVGLIEELHQKSDDDYIKLSDKAFFFAKNSVNLEEMKNSYKFLFNENKK